MTVTSSNFARRENDLYETEAIAHPKTTFATVSFGFLV